VVGRRREGKGKKEEGGGGFISFFSLFFSFFFYSFRFPINLSLFFWGQILSVLPIKDSGEGTLLIESSPKPKKTLLNPKFAMFSLELFTEF